MNTAYPDPVQYLAAVFGISNSLAFVLLVVLVAWSLIWKGLAMWRAARNRHTVWFLLFLVLNDIGILELIYLFWFTKRK